MKVIYGIENINEKYDNLVVALGTFDGIHLGHKKLIESAIKKADEINGTSMVFTFSPHPLEVLTSSSGPKLINSKEEKIQILEDLGLDIIVFANFTVEFSELHPEKFFKNILKEMLDVKELYVGFNYTFGKEGIGNTEYLKKLSKKYEMKINVLPAVKINNEIVSSTLIRKEITQGNLEHIKEKLGYNYMVIGEVIHGKKLGRELGFPTANLKLVNKVYPPYGVYGVKIKVEGETKKYWAIMNIGKNPTLKLNEHSLEVHIFNFDRDIYGEKIRIDLLEFIRIEKKFENKEKLISQIEKDIKNWKGSKKCH